jgi:DNA polymerase-1
MTQKLFLVDGSGFIFRAFHALPPLSSPTGVPVGAVYGFCNMLLKTIDQAQGHRLLVIFDAGRQTFRNEIYPDYKAHRPPPPPELVPQFSLVRDACSAFGVPCVELAGFEADDLIASYAKVGAENGHEVVIISSDKDLMQLINDQVRMYDPIKNKPIGPDEVVEKFGVPPAQVIDVQALAGDSTDNIPGVPGIGVKTAAELIKEYGSLESLLSYANTIKQPKRREALINNAENARISKKLVTLVTNTPLPISLDNLGFVNHCPKTLEIFLTAQGFNALRNRMNQRKSPPAPSVSYIAIQTIETLKEWIQKATEKGVVGFDTETTSLQPRKAKLVGFSLSIPDEGACYVPINHQTDEPQIPQEIALEILRPLLADSAVLKVGHNLKYDMGVLVKYGAPIVAYDDTMLMSYCLDAGKHGHSLDELARRHLNHTTTSYADVVGTGKAQKTFDMVPIDIATNYAAEDAHITLALHGILAPRLQAEGRSTLYQRIERPLVPVIVAMEQVGIAIDVPLLKAYGDDFDKRLYALEQEIHSLAGEPFNVASPKQLGEILFDKMSLPGGKKGKTGAYGTDVDILENLSLQGHTIAERVLSWRSIAKLKSTYVDGLMNAADTGTSRIYTSYSMVGAATGRLSSSDPNLQNIPIKTEDGRKIRKCFVPRPGYSLVSLDYSQIELRFLAHMAGVASLIEAFNQGQDIHKRTASELFSVPLDQVDNTLRRKAKTVNFGIIYGISPFGLGQQLGISTSDASQIIQAYLQRYPEIQTYMDKCIHTARETGYVETLFGRRCYVPTILDKNPNLRQFAERQAINAPLQGSNADTIKIAMRKIHSLLTTKAYEDTYMLLQVHDELLFEIPTSKENTIVASLKEIMENAVSLTVPLLVESGIGCNWDEAHS